MAKLALLGGKQVVQIPYETAKKETVSERAIESIVELCKKDEISISPIVNEFEKAWGSYVGAKYSLATNNGTASIAEALFAVGVQPKDEVIVPSFTFIFSAAPIASVGATAVFCDVDIDTHTMDPADIERRITPKTKAILIVHTWGNVADMDGIMAVAKKHNLRVIEDCSHAHGAEWKGKKVGTIGDVGCFSLQGSKSLPAGEGGILVTDNREYYERAIIYGHYERVGTLPENSKYRKYWTSMGYKHRAHPLGIAIAYEELKSLDDYNAMRFANGKFLDDSLRDIDCITPVKSPEGTVRQYSYHYGHYDETKLDGIALNTFLQALKAEGVMVGENGYGFLHEAALFEENQEGRLPLPNTLYLRERAFMMAPRFEKECKELLMQYAEAYHKVCRNIDELHDYENRKSKEGLSEAKKEYRSVNLL